MRLVFMSHASPFKCVISCALSLQGLERLLQVQGQTVNKALNDIDKLSHKYNVRTVDDEADTSSSLKSKSVHGHRPKKRFALIADVPSAFNASLREEVSGRDCLWSCHTDLMSMSIGLGDS